MTKTLPVPIPHTKKDWYQVQFEIPECADETALAEFCKTPGNAQTLRERAFAKARAENYGRG